MNKQEFILQLRKGLSGLPKDDIEERIGFYSEMIEDRMEDGLSEEQAVSAVGSIPEIVSQIISDTPLAKIAKETIKPKRKLKTLEIILLALGSPIWLSLGIAAVAVILAVYASLWSLIIALWAIFASLMGSSIGGIAAGVILICFGNTLSGAALLGLGLVCAGISIFTFFGCKGATKGILLLTKKTTFGIKNCFIKREENI